MLDLILAGNHGQLDINFLSNPSGGIVSEPVNQSNTSLKEIGNDSRNKKKRNIQVDILTYFIDILTYFIEFQVFFCLKTTVTV